MKHKVSCVRDRSVDFGGSQTRATLDSTSQAFPIMQFEWRIEPHRLAVRTHPTGAPWQLGVGAYGKVCNL